MTEATTLSAQLQQEIQAEQLDYSTLQYADYVNMGKELLTRIEGYQARVAFYACKVCDIRHGGPSGNYYTLTDYARDIGLPQKTLANWTRTYRHVIQKLGIPVCSVNKQIWKIASRIDERMSWDVRRLNREDQAPKSKAFYKDKVAIEELKRMWQEESNELPSFHSELRRWITTMQAVAHNLPKRDLSLAEPADLLELMQLCDRVGDAVNDYLSRKK